MTRMRDSLHRFRLPIVVVALLVAAWFAMRSWHRRAKADGEGSEPPAAAPVGTIGGDFSVGDDGSARYSIKLTVPPGAHRMEPGLDLAYDSGERNGVVGMGFTLRGLSTISRMGANLEQDGFRGGITYSSTDRFALEGRRLIAVTGSDGAAGSVYRTETESWQVVTAGADPATGQMCGSGPCVFTVATRNGITMQFGASTDSRVLASGRAEVRVWALTSITDSNGNGLSVTYAPAPLGGSADGEVYPSSIAYTTNAAAGLSAHLGVAFGWGSRTDVDTVYAGGSSFQRTAILSTITTSVQGSAVKQYRLAYATAPVTGRSRLTSVTECDGTGAAATCLPPTTFSWQSMGGAFSDQGTWLSNQMAYPTWTAQNPRYLADVTGSGRLDLVGFQQDTQVATSDGSSFAGATSWNSGFGSNAGYTTVTPVMLGDVTGDGKSDVVGFDFDGVEVAPSTGASFDTSTWSPSAYPYFGFNQGWDATNNPRIVIDVNGDGLSDVVGFLDKTYVGLSTGNAFASPVSWNDGDFSGPAWYTSTGQFRLVGDVNGDGMADVVGFTSQGVLVGIATCQPSCGFVTSAWGQTDATYQYFSIGQGWDIDVHPRVLADVNGDGLLDIVGFMSGVQVGLSTGHGFLAPQTWSADFSAESPTPWPSQSQTPRSVVDLDGDAKADVVGFAAAPTGTQVALSSGAAFSGAPWNQSSLSNYTAGGPNLPLLTGDVNGDGMADIVALGLANQAQPNVFVGVAAPAYPDLLTGIVNGLDGAIAVSHAPLTTGSIYSESGASITTPGGAARFNAPPSFTYNPLLGAYPMTAVANGQRYIVSQVATTQRGSAPAYTYSSGYQYRNALYDLLAQRWLGFETRTETEVEQGRATILTYSQVFPQARMVTDETVACAGTSPDPACSAGAKMLETITTYQNIQSATGSGSKQVPVYAVAPASMQKNLFTYGKFDFGYLESYQNDQYGDPLMVTYDGSVAQDGTPLPSDATFYTCHVYEDLPNATPWQLGYPTFVKQTTNSANCGASVSTWKKGDISLRQYTYDTKAGASGTTMNLLTSAVWDSALGIYLTTTYACDLVGNTKQTTTPAGNSTLTAFDATYLAYPERTVMPISVGGKPLTAFHSYDPATGNLVGDLDPNGNLIGTCYDTLGRPAGKQGPPPPSVLLQVPTITTCAPSRATDWSNIQAAAVVQLATTTYPSDPSGVVYTLTEDLQAWPTHGSGGEQRSTQTFQDGKGRVYATIEQGDPTLGNILTCTAYDADDRIVRQSMPQYVAGNLPTCDAAGISWVTTSYDVIGRPLTRTEPLGPAGASTTVTTFAYPDQLTTRRTRASGTADAFLQVLAYGLYNGDRKLLGLQAPAIQPGANNNATAPKGSCGALPTDAGVASYGFDPTGRLLTTTDPNGVATVIAYDSVGRKSTVTTPALGLTTYAYDGTGLLHSVTTPSGTTTFTYDAMERVLVETRPDAVITRTYDGATTNGLMNLTSVTQTDATGHATSSFSFGYDGYNRESFTTTTIGSNDATSTSTLFDPQGRPAVYTWPDKTALTRRFAHGNLASLAVGTTTIAAYTNYSPRGSVGNVAWNGSAGGSSAWTYAPTGEPATYQRSSASGGTIISLEYAINGLRLLTATTAPSGQPTDFDATYTYSKTRLLGSTGSAGSHAYWYDAAGNVAFADGVTYSYANQQATTGADGSCKQVFTAGYTNGAMTSRTQDAASTKYSWDWAMQLVGLTSAGGTSSFVYGFDGTRLSRTTSDGKVTLFVDAQLQIDVASGVSTTTKYVTDEKGSRVAAIVSGGASTTTSYYALDHLGSTMLVLDGTGSPQSTVLYAPYGTSTVSGTDAHFPKFVGRQLEPEAPLYWMPSRYYDPGLGRFLSADPNLGAETDMQDAQNRYAYAGNSPLSFRDPTGHVIWPLWSGAGQVSGVEYNATVAAQFQSWTLPRLQATWRMQSPTFEASGSADLSLSGRLTGSFSGTYQADLLSFRTPGLFGPSRSISIIDTRIPFSSRLTGDMSLFRPSTISFSSEGSGMVRAPFFRLLSPGFRGSGTAEIPSLLTRSPTVTFGGSGDITGVPFLSRLNVAGMAGRTGGSVTGTAETTFGSLSRTTTFSGGAAPVEAAAGRTGGSAMTDIMEILPIVME